MKISVSVHNYNTYNSTWMLIELLKDLRTPEVASRGLIITVIMLLTKMITDYSRGLSTV